MRTLTVLAICALVDGVRPAWADDVPLGTWPGFAIRTTGNNQNRQMAQLIVKKVPDPHILWRGGSAELTSVVFVLQNQQREVGSISLANGRLTFSFTTTEGEDTTCALTLDPKEGAYVGECMARRLTLMPPPPAKPGDAKPAEAK